MAENISAFAAYNSSNEISASTVNGMRKNKSNKTGRTPIKLTINKKKMAASKSNKWKVIAFSLHILSLFTIFPLKFYQFRRTRNK